MTTINIRVLSDGQLQVLEQEDGELPGRYVIKPGEDASGRPQEVQDAVTLHHDSATITAFEAAEVIRKAEHAAKFG